MLEKQPIAAIYEHGQLCLLDKVELQEGQKVKITIDTEEEQHEADKQALLDLLDSWSNVSEEEAQEQKETLEFLMKALDEDRLSDRKLFPDRHP